VTLEKYGEARLLPPPSQKLLAKQFKVHESSISRAIKDKSDKEMAILWEIANDVSQILKFRG
jgi:DNA-directed RNA polymerase specialized sigma54-like protein